MHNCDGCTACCKVLKIRELDKPAHAWCQHCKIGTGCGIYETRPESCRIYECIWLQTQRLPKPIPFELRPDKSKVVIGTINHGEELVFYVSPDRPNAWNHGEFSQFVTEMRSLGIRMHVSLGEDLRVI